MTAADTPMQPLAGVQVVDFSHVIAGPLASFYLAQLGATVVKVEAPGGDVMRGSAQGAAQFAAFNAGKQCRTIDLHTEAGRAEALALAERCDVLVDNFRPGVLARLGLGHVAVRARNPRLISCAISGYGTQHAGWARRGAYDHVIQALTGMAMLAGGEGDPPVKTGFPVVDVMTGVLAAFAITAAVQERERTGRGWHVDVSMWAAALQLMYPFSVDVMAGGSAPARVGNKGYSGSPAAEYFEASDGFIAIGANTPRQIAKLYEVLGWPAAQAGDDLVQGPGFARARDPDAFRTRLAAALRTRTAQAWEDALHAAGVPAARVRTLDSFVRDAQAAGALVPHWLELDGVRVPSPGLGWTSVPA
ncbi:MAG: CoA transferase [Ottowia sp.]|uniref:CaiB/BaiF CoA transferase family protein n=1 Tax=Ottowia sp. TaxID=1898956 RepID=UPI0039E301B8